MDRGHGPILTYVRFSGSPGTTKKKVHKDGPQTKRRIQIKPPTTTARRRTQEFRPRPRHAMRSKAIDSPTVARTQAGGHSQCEMICLCEGAYRVRSHPPRPRPRTSRRNGSSSHPCPCCAPRRDAMRATHSQRPYARRAARPANESRAAPRTVPGRIKATAIDRGGRRVVPGSAAAAGQGIGSSCPLLMHVPSASVCRLVRARARSSTGRRQGTMESQRGGGDVCAGLWVSRRTRARGSEASRSFLPYKRQDIFKIRGHKKMHAWMQTYVGGTNTCAK
jgi:hypothetical protein